MTVDDIDLSAFKHPVAYWLATQARDWLISGPTSRMIAEALLTRAQAVEAENCRERDTWDCRRKVVVQLQIPPYTTHEFVLPESIRKAAWNPLVTAEWRQ